MEREEIEGCDREREEVTEKRAKGSERQGDIQSIQLATEPGHWLFLMTAWLMCGINQPRRPLTLIQTYAGAPAAAALPVSTLMHTLLYISAPAQQI